MKAGCLHGIVEKMGCTISEGGTGKTGATMEKTPTPSKCYGMPVWAWVLIGMAGLMLLMGGLLLAAAMFWFERSS